MKKKTKSIKLTDYFMMKNPEYVYLKLITTSSVRNNNAIELVKIINDVYTKVEDRFKKQNKGFEYIRPSKVSFIIDITRDNCEFFMIIPKLHLKTFTQKLTEAFGKITIEEVEGIKAISRDCLKYSLNCAKDDSLSLAVDKRDNDLLSANMSVMEIMEDDERITVIYNFIPQSKFKLATWKNYHQSMIEKYNKGECLDKDLTFMKVLKTVAIFFLNTIDAVVDSFQQSFGDKKNPIKKESYSRMIPVQELTKASIKKEKATVVRTQILVCSQANSKEKEKENMNTMINTFSAIDGDNKLKANKVNNKKISLDQNKNLNLEVLEFPNASNNFSEEEIGSNMTVLPGKTLIEEHKIQSIQHVETKIPEELQGGSVRYGTNKYRGQDTTVTTSTNEDANCMPVVVMAKMGGGKTSLFENNGVDAVKNGESLIAIDFIKNCEMSDNIIRNIDKEKTVVINFADYMCQEGFGFNEIDLIRDSSNPMSRYECASLQNTQITQFIDSLGEEEFSASMGRYLDAACTAVLIHENKSIRDVVKCLECYKTREEYMCALEEFKLTMPEMYQDLVDEDLVALEELNEYRDIKVGNKKTGEVELCGTANSKISGIISRLSKLKKSPALKLMYARSPKNNINLVELMQQGKAIFFKMPQSRFSSEISKNILVSYLFSKIEIAGIIRAEVYGEENLRTVNVICDEIQQAKDSFNNISEICYQLRKFRTKLIISTHGWHKIAPIRDILISSGCSVIMLRGSSPKDFDVMKEEFEKFGFSKDDLISLNHTDDYKALCLIATKRGRHGCIVKLPDLVKNKIEEENKNHVIEVDFSQVS